MAKETKVWEIIKSAGYDPIENKNIIVSYAPRNLSDSIVKFLGCSNEFFVLQICKDALVLVPFGKLMMELKKGCSGNTIKYDKTNRSKTQRIELFYYD